MFVSQAHSFVHQARLSITLSWVAGYTNIITFLTCGQATSHISGTASQLGRDVADGRWRPAAYVSALLAAFFAGAVLSGGLTELGRSRRWASIYVLPMAVEAALLALFAVLIDWNAIGELGGASALWLTLIPSLAMGLQNATISRISGGVVRTTHVTGVLTDLGMETALWGIRSLRHTTKDSGLRGTFATPVRLTLLASILGGFVLGATAGTLAFDFDPRWCMVPAVVFLVVLVVADVLTPIARVSTHRESGGDLADILPAGVVLYHILPDSGRRAGSARIPSLTAWAEGLDRSARVVVLDFADTLTLDANALIDLRIVAAELMHSGRELVLAGISPARFASLNAAHVLATLPPANVCSDLELAVARACTLLGAASLQPD